MPTIKLTSSEIAEQGEAIYRERLQADLEPGNVGKFVVIDINTGEYEMGDDHYMEPMDKMRGRLPNAELFIMKIGYPAAVSIGGRLKPNVP